MKGETYILYGAEPSYYTGKVRCYLRKKGIRFREASSGHPGFAKAAEKAGSTKIPILEAPDGTVVQDTTDIIDYLEPLFPQSPAYPAMPKQCLAAMLLEVFGDECMLKPAMHYRWNFPDENFPFIFREFGRAMAPQLPMEEAEPLLVKFADRMQSYLPALGVTTESIPVVESAYEELLALMNDHLRLNPYFLGGRPTLGDYGMMGPMYAHLGRDIYPHSQLKKLAPFVNRWVERMNASDGGLAEFWDAEEVLPPKDGILESLIPILKYFFDDYGPELSMTLDAVNARAKSAGKGAPVVEEGKPNLGVHEVPYRGLTLTQGIRHFSIYMLQRPILYFQSLDEDDRADAEAFLNEIGGAELFNTNIERPMVRKKGVEVFA